VNNLLIYARVKQCTQIIRVYYLLIAESHLPPGVPGNVHPAQKHSLASLVFGGSLTPGQFGLYGLMVLLVDHVVHAVAVYEEILLRTETRTNARLNRTINEFRHASSLLFLFLKGQNRTGRRRRRRRAADARERRRSGIRYTGALRRKIK